MWARCDVTFIRGSKVGVEDVCEWNYCFSASKKVQGHY